MEAEAGREDIDGDFDLEATIAEFIRNEARTSLELPRTLSTEQRKVARRLADQHPGLKCHSYGIGTDRQMHLFKKEVGRVPSREIGVIGQGRAPDGGHANQVRVKNTFIDDWVGGDGDPVKEEPLICRSMPAGSGPQSLFEQTLQRAFKEGHLDLSPVVESGYPRNGPEILVPSSVKDECLISPGSSTGHERSIYMGSSPGSSVPSGGLPPLPESSLPPLPDGLKVSMRNTFIHIESAPVEQRIVQSMPDGMFRQCLNAELAAKSHGNGNDAEMSDEESSLRGLTGPLLSTPPMSASPPPLSYAPLAQPAPSVPLTPSRLSESASPFIAIGTEVIIQNLVKLPAFNGLSGIVQCIDADTGRYDVQLCDPSAASGWRRVKVKSDNLIVQVPPAPPYTPTIHLEEGAQPTDWEEDQGKSVPFHLNGLV